jgi:hypothetical protein
MNVKDRQTDMKKKIRGGVFSKNICKRANERATK